MAPPEHHFSDSSGRLLPKNEFQPFRKRKEKVSVGFFEVGCRVRTVTMEELEEGNVRAEFACDSDEERREIHEETVNEHRLAREEGELDEGQDASDDEEPDWPGAEELGSCHECGEVLFPDRKPIHMVRYVSDDKGDGEQGEMVRMSFCDQCRSHLGGPGWIIFGDDMAGDPIDIPAIPSMHAKKDIDETIADLIARSRLSLVDGKVLFIRAADLRKTGLSYDEMLKAVKAHLGVTDSKQEQVSGRPRLEAVKPVHVPTSFRYTNSLGRENEDGTPMDYDDAEKYIRNIAFNISRYGDHVEIISFKEPVTEKTAIEAAEAFLSKPVTEEYYEMVKEDLCDSETPWEQAKHQYANRGALLTDCRFLESLDDDGDGNVTISCGS